MKHTREEVIAALDLLYGLFREKVAAWLARPSLEEIYKDDEPQQAGRTEAGRVYTPHVASQTATEPDDETKARLELVEAARVFLNKQSRELEQADVWDPEKWTEQPPDEVRAMIAHVAKVGWAAARRGDKPMQEEEEHGEQTSPSGDDLPKSLPFRQSLVNSGLTLDKISEKWKAGHLKTIDGIGAKGAQKIGEWFEQNRPVVTLSVIEGGAGEAESSGASETPAGEEDEEPTVDELLDVLGARGGAINLPDGDVLQLGMEEDGFRLVRTTESGVERVVPPLDQPPLSKPEALERVRRILEPPDNESPGPREPEVGDPVILQAPGGAATYRIAEIKGENALLAAELYDDGEGQFTGHSGIEGTVLAENLTWLMATDPPEWSVAVSKVQTED